MVADARVDSGLDAGKDAGRDGGVDAGRDSGTDAGHDAGFDAGFDASVDSGNDAGYDAGPTCECSTGACCDGCHFRPATFICGANIPTNAVCQGASYAAPPPPATSTCFGTVEIAFDVANRYCSGASSTCSGSIVQTGSSMSGNCAYADGDGSPQTANNPILCQPDPGDVAGNRCHRCF